MMTQDQLKEQVARKALEFVKPNTIIGIGSGSTVRKFINLLPELPFKVKAAVAASKESEAALTNIGIPVLDANEVVELEVYIDGADEVTPEGYMIKGGGAALTREKILASLSKEFICIVDKSKCVTALGTTFALPIEVIPMAREVVKRQLASLGATPLHRVGVITDNGNELIDLHNFVIDDPIAMEKVLNCIPGIVTNGIFAQNKANKILVA